MKKIDEMKAQYKELLCSAQQCMDEQKFSEAKAKMDEAKELRIAMEVQEQLDAEERRQLENEAKSKKPVPAQDAIKQFAAAARTGFKASMNEGTPADGGYTVPEDILTYILEYRSSKKSLMDLVTVEKVTTKSGARTFKKRSQQTGFSKVAEGGAIGAKATPQFERIAYSIDKYAGYFPVTNELLKDSDANIVNVLATWIGDESRVTGNKLILEQINTKAKTSMASLDDIKKALNVTLGSAFKGTSKLVTNDDGLNWLDTLKDVDGRYLLQPSPSDPMALHLCAGATTVPVEVIPNSDMPSEDAYQASTDTAVKTGKTYYTRTGEGSTESPYVYAKVESPTGNPSTSSYYEKYSGIPMIIGDLKQGIVYWDRELMSIKTSDVAVVGDLNAYEDDLTLFRAIEREDVTPRDTEAFVNGQIIA